MRHYFLMLDGQRFRERLQPAFTACWRARSFAPGQKVFAELADDARAFAARYPLGEPPLIHAAAAGNVRFDRAVWRHLVGEAVLFAAIEVPEIEVAPEVLRRLLPVGLAEQAVNGSQALVFGGAHYRPEAAGWNDSADVARLAVELAAVVPADWHAETLIGLEGLDDAADRAEELEVAREWFPALAELYRQAHERRQVVICERIE